MKTTVVFINVQNRLKPYVNYNIRLIGYATGKISTKDCHLLMKAIVKQPNLHRWSSTIVP